MPRRTAQHEIGDKALYAVQKVLGDAGFAVDVVHHDYGDDLLVQTSHAGEVDASRLWFQVKGTSAVRRHRRRDGSLTYSVPTAQAIRWARSTDHVVVVLWDVEDDVGYYTRPAAHVDQLRWVEVGSGRTILRFEPDHVFDAQVAEMLAWESRIDHHLLRLLLADERLEEEREDGGDEEGQTKYITMLTLDFLRTLGMVERHPEAPGEFRCTAAVLDAFKTLLAEAFEEGVEHEELSSVLYGVVFTLLFDHVAENAGGAGLPARVIAGSSSILLALLNMSQFIEDEEPGS